MEMHQVRYFLAVARALNFTRAAEECNVAQPSLTRAIRQLEGELGGDLFRRERPHAQLTELGERMLPLLKQCYDSALSARSLASAIKKGEVGSLRLALSRSIDPALVTPHVVELGKLFSGLELKLLRGSSAEVLEYLKSGEVELAIAGPVDEEWDRLDSWPLFTEILPPRRQQRPCPGQDRCRRARRSAPRAADAAHLLREHGDPTRSLARAGIRCRTRSTR